jgi:hypothetical protein
MNKARALIFYANCKKYMWDEAVQTAAYLANRSPTNGMSHAPAENWYQRRPDLSNLQIFGQKVFEIVVKSLKKLDSRSEEAIFVGYAPNGYRLRNEYERKIFVERDVIFINTFPLSIQPKRRRD